jgi:hypothetical protein
VAAETPLCPRFPRLSQDGKEGVDGSNPSEGSSRVEIPVNRGFLLPRTASQRPPRDMYGPPPAAARTAQSACKGGIDRRRGVPPGNGGRHDHTEPIASSPSGLIMPFAASILPSGRTRWTMGTGLGDRAIDLAARDPVPIQVRLGFRLVAAVVADERPRAWLRGCSVSSLWGLPQPRGLPLRLAWHWSVLVRAGPPLSRATRVAPRR